MSRSFLAAILLAPAAALADASPVTIAADRILGVYGQEEYGENDWNGDDHSDLAVLAVSEAGDSVDLYLATSDPGTGLRAVTEVIRAILPYDPVSVASGGLEYNVSPAHEGYKPEVHISSSATLARTSIITNPRVEGSGIVRIASSRRVPGTNRAEVICEIVFVEYGVEGFEPWAKVIAPDGTELSYNPGPGPLLSDWNYTDLPAPCLP